MNKGFADQQQQFKILHRDKYLPLKETASLLDSQLKQAQQANSSRLHTSCIYSEALTITDAEAARLMAHTFFQELLSL